MLNPIRLCNDLFDDRELFDGDLRPFTENHLVRISNPDNNPGGIYNTQISDTTTKYNNYYGKITNEATKKAISEGTTITKNNARAAAEEKISQLQGLVKYKFGEPSDIYQEFYPLGMDEYYQAREGVIAVKFTRFVNAATTHLTADYPAEVAAITGLVSSFTTAYAACESIRSQVDNVTTGKHEDRKILTTQLTFNFLTIASNNIDRPDKFDDYYDARFLPLDKDNGIRTGIVPGGQVVHIPTSGVTINGDTEILLKNTGAVPLRFYFAATETAEPGATYIDVTFGTEVTTTAAALGLDGTNTFFNVKNEDAPGGSYRVEIG